MLVLVDARGEPLSGAALAERLSLLRARQRRATAHYLYFKEQVVQKALTAIQAFVKDPPATGVPYRFAYACALDDSACGSRLLRRTPEPR